MSDNYQTDEEQIEAIKKWWAENGKSTVAGILIAVAGVFGWQGWQKQQQEASYAASAAYQNLMKTVVEAEGKLEGEGLATATHLADSLKAEHASSVYAQFAALYKAQFAVNSNDLEQAEAELRWVLAQNPAAEINAQARLRLARVLLAKQQHEQALSELSGETDGYKPLYLELKGDIYLAKGDADKAREFYQQAKLLNAEDDAAANNLLDLKLQQLTPVEGA